MAGPIKYVGRTTDFKGKTLWEIAGNLKNYGIGRIIARNMFERYPEPCFMKILKVEPLPAEENPMPFENRKVRMWVQKTFRGKTLEKPVIIESVSYKADYKLIPKDEEEAYCKLNECTLKEEQIIPNRMEFPPVMKILLEKDYKERGIPMPEGMTIRYNKSPNRTNKIASEDDKPYVPMFSIGLGTPRCPNLYKGVLNEA